MSPEKQKLILEYLISCPTIFEQTQDIVKPEYFDPEFRYTINFIFKYYNDYKSLPNAEQVKAESNVVLSEKEITKDKVEYSVDEIERFCKHRAISLAISESIDLLEEENYWLIEQKVKDAILVSLKREMGIQYFENPRERVMRSLIEQELISTGWRDLDKALDGGLARKEMILFAANSGGGKSVTLMNLAYNFLKQKKDVLYLTLELAAKTVSQRYDQLISGVSRGNRKQNVEEIIASIEDASPDLGRLTIEWMPSETKALSIRAYLKTFALRFGSMPDLLIVDYLDKMAPNQNIKTDNIWLKDKYCSEQIRDIAVTENFVLATASQLGREAIRSVEHDQAHIAGGISKINESDVVVSIRMTDQMRAQNRCEFKLLKTRNSGGVGGHIQLRWDDIHLRLRSAEKMEPNYRRSRQQETPDDSDDNSGSDMDQLVGMSFD